MTCKIIFKYRVHQKLKERYLDIFFIYPARACASRGYVIVVGVHLYIMYVYIHDI